MTDSDDALERARQHIERIRDFWYHFMVFVIISLLLVILDRRGGETGSSVFGLDWAYWVVLFWGLGVAGHAIWAVFDDYRAERLSGRS